MYLHVYPAHCYAVTVSSSCSTALISNFERGGPTRGQTATRGQPGQPYQYFSLVDPCSLTSSSVPKIQNQLPNGLATLAQERWRQRASSINGRQNGQNYYQEGTLKHVCNVVGSMIDSIAISDIYNI
jgi:hypothetical protein